jgi:hypothetical protein
MVISCCSSFGALTGDPDVDVRYAGTLLPGPVPKLRG